MTLREKILKTFVVTIREINRHGGPEEFFKKYPTVGGMYYMPADGPYDEEGREMGSGMSFETLARCRNAAPEDFLICADFARMHNQTVSANHRSLGSIDDEKLAYDYGKIIGMQMNAHNIDWVLGPSIDILVSPTNVNAAVSDDPEYTARIYRQVVRGIQDQGICATIKHFPGLGTHNVNMHLAPGRNVLPFDEWMEIYGYAYKEINKEKPMLVMNTHTTLFSYDDSFTDGYYPSATYSKKLNEDLLRKELGFKGAIVTDALIMGGMSTGDLVESTAQAFKCGGDLLLWPPMEAAERIEEKILSGEIPMSRLDEAVARIDEMIAFRKKAKEEKNYDEPNVDFVNQKSGEITEKGICCLRNELGLLPLSPEKHKKITILDATDTNQKSVTLLQEELTKRGIDAVISREAYDAISEVWWQEQADSVAEGQDMILVVVDGNYCSKWNNTFLTIWGSHMLDKKKKVIINFGSPYFAPDYFPEDPTYIEMNTGATPFAVRALAERLFGEKEFTGKSVLRRQK
ncbi:MAG: hypothetical protein IKL80_05765 [Clostridia bacterium]|nr:hypothetical protein [Clostridia bacterium]